MQCFFRGELKFSGRTLPMFSAVFILFLVLLSACAGSNLSKERDGGDLTRGEVEYLNRKLVEAIEKEYPLLQHKGVNRYVDSLGQSIVSRNPSLPPLPYEFRVLRTEEINSFSLPGGIIYLSLGLLRSVQLEAQLASAISHELAHQQLAHSLQAWRRRVNAKRGQAYTLDFGSDFDQAFFASEGALRYAEGAEEEADRLTPVLLYRAKFDPRAYQSFLLLLKRLELQNPGSLARLRMAHPEFNDRIVWAKEAQNSLPPLRDPKLSSQSFEQIRSLLKSAAEAGAQVQKKKPKQKMKKNKKTKKKRKKNG